MPLLSDGDIALVQDSFRLASVAPETLAAACFRRLFELDRSLRRLFHGDMRQSGQKLITTLGARVASLRRFDDFTPTMRALGARAAAASPAPRAATTCPPSSSRTPCTLPHDIATS